MNEDAKYMMTAVDLARTQIGVTSPDPLVGAVLVKNGKIISKGYHAQYSSPHAEEYAINKAGRGAKGATLYVNLEPCCHFGNNPPCTQAIIRAGIKRVVIAMQDPNPLVSGKGIRELRQAGIKVTTGIMEADAREINEAFIKFITQRKPFFILKSAMTLDGKIATSTGESRWISSKASRQFVHYLRSSVDAVMVGLGTVIKDDPELTVRDVGRRKIVKRDPKRIILDSLAKIPLKSRVIRKDPNQTIIVVTKNAPRKRLEALRKKGVSILTVKSKAGRIDLKDLALELGERDFMSVMIEGGGTINAAAISAGIIDKVYVFISPKIFGGSKAKTMIGGKGIKSVTDAISLDKFKVLKMGEDVLIEGYIGK